MLIMELFHPVKISMWRAVSQYRVTCPVFFEETANAEHYHGILIQFITLG
jgi:hypothetical protein